MFQLTAISTHHPYPLDPWPGAHFRASDPCASAACPRGEIAAPPGTAWLRSGCPRRDVREGALDIHWFRG